MVTPICDEDAPGATFEPVIAKRLKPCIGGDMAIGVNKVILVGTLGRDPELKYTTSGTAICSLSVATSESWKDKSGDKQERTEWHRVKVWTAMAENCGKYLQKGSQVYVEGKLRTQKYQAKDGSDRWATEVQAHVVTFLGGKPQASEQPSRDDYPPRVQASSAGSVYAQDNGFSDADIPF